VSYQILARKWRPQRFEEVVGQQAVTQTLRNALVSGRVAQAFVFAGARGVGKTTTARILAKALNCVNGPTPDPCGQCEACVEIAQGRSIDVLEIDAATHTGIDNIREVIISGLAMAPVRDRYKVFIIDEVHQLSASSFNALLKSIEEPPPHVVFLMATTELHKIPDTILSRAQVYEFRTIATTAITAELTRIAKAEGIDASTDALALVSRSAEGSMRDAQSALDQVIAFAGTTVTAEDVATVLGLVGRDLLFDVLSAVADEDSAAAFALAGRAVDAGYDLRILCRELAALVRAMMLVSIDPKRIEDPELVFESDRARLGELTPRFSREDLLRSFDLLARAEQDVRSQSQPRYALEMALVKWIHLRKLVPIADLIDDLEKGGAPSLPPGGRPTAGPGGGSSRPASQGLSPRPAFGPRATTPPPTRRGPMSSASRAAAPAPAPVEPAAGMEPAAHVEPAAPVEPVAPGSSLSSSFKERFLSELQRTNRTFYSLHVAQAQRIDVDGARVVFTFGPIHETMRQQVERKRQWLESVAASIAGRKVTIATARGEASRPEGPREVPLDDRAAPAAKPSNPDLKARAMADSGVQAMLEVFPAEIRDVEEIE
jgi:DNA polymerase III subunit gamma/tau